MAVSQTILLSALLVSLVAGHSYFSSIAIDGTQLKEDDCIRPHPSSRYDYPISSLDNPNGINSADMTCGWLPNAAKAANRKCPVKPGSTVAIQWHYERGQGSADTFIIDPSHVGPCIVYMAKSETGAGAVWFKIFEEGYDASAKKWCVDKLRANKGVFSVKIPTDIAPGNYLFRTELIALHEGHKVGGAQPYVGCAELTVSGSGTVDPPNKVAFPGAYTARDAGIFFSPYNGKNANYVIPGPKLYVSGTSAPTQAPTPAPTKAPTQAPTPAPTKAPTKAPTQAPTQAPTKAPTKAPTQANDTPSGSCTLGHQTCVGASTYKTCGWVGNNVPGWGDAVQTCPSGLGCHQVQDNYVWCY